jgi:hypothetical protein
MTEIKTIKVKYDNETEISKKLIDKIIKEEMDKANADKGLIPIEQNIYEIRTIK